MLNSLCASRALRIALNFITKPTASYVVCLHRLQEHHPSLKLFHSISDVPEFSIPRKDYTVNKEVARANWMVTKLCREGRVAEAHQLFDEMPERDVITWTALISGYMKSGMVKEGRTLFDRIDALKNGVTWTAMISGYLSWNQNFEAERLFDEMPEKNVVAWNTMIDGYVKGCRIEQALALFNRMEDRNIVSWHMVIMGLINSGRVEEARGLFDRMPERNVISWNILVSGLARNGRIDEARLMFDQMPERNVVSWNAMVTGYAQNMRLAEAYTLFLSIPAKNILSWNTMITGFIQNGELAKATKLFHDMPRKNVVSWTAMISGCGRHGETEEALKMFIAMKRDRRVKLNEWTFLSVLGACSDLAGLCEGKQVHQAIIKTVYQENQHVISALMNMYSKCGELAMVKQMFNDPGSIWDRDLVMWNSMIAAYAHHGCGREAITIFGEMQSIGLKPNDVSYVGLLTACSHAGLVQEGLNYFDALVKDGYIELREEHYACVVDLYSRAGRLKEAFDLLEQAQLKASAYAWGALLLGCSIHGNTDVGKKVANKLLRTDPENCGTYLFLLSMYTRAGEWREVEKVKSRMRDRGLKKQPGCSWIEAGNELHVFVVGDRSDREIGTILSNLHEEMKLGFSVSFEILVEGSSTFQRN